MLLFKDDFERGIQDWSVSDSSSVYSLGNNYLYIGPNGAYDDFAEHTFSIGLTSNSAVIIEQRIKLESGGKNYRLPWEIIYFEDGDTLTSTDLPYDGYGWNIGGWTGNMDNSVPGDGYWSNASANYWAVTRIVLSSTEVTLYIKPDDPDRGWDSDKFVKIATKDMTAHSEITKIRFIQPWDSTNYIDYIRITSVKQNFSFIDNFDDGKISNKWAVTTTSSTGLTVTEHEGLLELAGQSTIPLSIAQVEKNKLLTASPSAKATVKTQIRLGEGAQDFGSTARIVLFKDSDNFLVFGMVDPSGVYYQRKQGGDTLTQTVLSIPRDAQFHDYRIQYDGNQSKLYFDGEVVATVDIELTTFKVWLQGHTYHRGPGAVLGEFDRFEVSAPLPN